MVMARRKNEGIGHHQLGGDLGRDDVPAAQRKIGLTSQQPLHRRLGEVLAGQFELDAGAL
jgi:hypothetical protein